MDLDLDIVRTRGRAAVPVTASYVRDLGEADVALITSEKGSKAPSLKRLSDPHHALAPLSSLDAALPCGRTLDCRGHWGASRHLTVDHNLRSVHRLSLADARQHSRPSRRLARRS